MKPGLSKREKILIFIAIIFAVVFLSFRFVIAPMYAFYTLGLEEYEVILSEKDAIDLKFENETRYVEGHARARVTFEEIKKRYPEIMPNEEVDRILTGICLQNKLNPVMLGISDMKIPELTRQAEEGEEVSKTPAAFAVVTATMNLSGDYDSLKSLINAVEKIDYIHISRISFSNRPITGDTGASNISVFFEITMLNDTR